MHINSRPHGATLLETVMAAGVFAMVISICFSITLRTTKSFGEQIHEGTLLDKSEKVLKTMEEELGDATLIASQFDPNDPDHDSLFSVTANGYTFQKAEIHYRVPLRFKSSNGNPFGYTVFLAPPNAALNPTFPSDNVGNGDYDFRLRYGWRDPGRYIGNAEDNGNLAMLQGPGLLPSSGTTLPPGVTVSTVAFTATGGMSCPVNSLKGGYMCIRFQPDSTLRVGKFGNNGIFSEAAEGTDLNGDVPGNSHYLTDYYAVGYLERCYFIGDPGNEVLVQESRQRLGDGMVLQPLPTSFDSTGPADQLRSNRIFNRDADNFGRLNIFVWMFTMDGEGQPHMHQAKVSIFMRNNATYVTSSSATGTTTN